MNLRQSIFISFPFQEMRSPGQPWLAGRSTRNWHWHFNGEKHLYADEPYGVWPPRVQWLIRSMITSVGWSEMPSGCSRCHPEVRCMFHPETLEIWQPQNPTVWPMCSEEGSSASGGNFIWLHAKQNILWNYMKFIMCPTVNTIFPHDINIVHHIPKFFLGSMAIFWLIKPNHTISNHIIISYKPKSYHIINTMSWYHVRIPCQNTISQLHTIAMFCHIELPEGAISWWLGSQTGHWQRPVHSSVSPTWRRVGHGIHGMILTLGHALRLWGPWYGTDQRMFSWCAPDFCLFLHKQIMCIKMLMYGQRLSGKDGEVWWSMVKYCRELRELPWWKGLPSPSPWPAWKYFFV